MAAEQPASEDWSSVAVGRIQLALDATDPCCLDYALASDSSNTIRVIYGATREGFTVFEDGPDDAWAAGGFGSPGISHVALADLDGSQRNELLALRMDGWISVRQEKASAPWFSSTLDEYDSAVTQGNLNAEGENNFVIGDLDCDGDLDVALPSPGEGVIVMVQDRRGDLVADTILANPASPQRVALSDLDGDGKLDIVTSNADGGFGVYVSDCNPTQPGVDFQNVTNVGVFQVDTDTTNMPVAVGDFCDGGAKKGVAVGWFDDVRITCSDGSGGFSGVVEAHGQTDGMFEFDYAWDIWPSSSPTNNGIRELAAFPGHAELVAVGKVSSAYDQALLLAPGTTCGLEGRPSVPLAVPWASNAHTRGVVHPDAPSATRWARLVLVGEDGIAVLR